MWCAYRLRPYRQRRVIAHYGVPFARPLALFITSSGAHPLSIKIPATTPFVELKGCPPTMTRVFGAATTLLLLSTGLLDYSQGSLSSHVDNKVIRPFLLDLSSISFQDTCLPEHPCRTVLFHANYGVRIIGNMDRMYVLSSHWPGWYIRGDSWLSII